MTKQHEIFIMPPQKKQRLKNLMLIGGSGPEGKRCKHCKHLFVKRMGNKYFKCALRQNTNGPATDHRMNYQACWKFEPL